MSTVDISADYLSPLIDRWNFTEKPLIVGVSGPQGSGKSYLAENLVSALVLKYPQLNIVNVSIDDFYLTHHEQKELPTRYPGCGLVTDGRGLPGTHSVDLVSSILRKIKARESGFDIPVYDKSKFKGEGDRLPISQGKSINKPVDVVIFEGWFLGFKSVDHELENVWSQAIQGSENAEITKFLTRIDYKQIELIDQLLKNYEYLWSMFDRFIYLATNDLLNIYQWRLQQEYALIKSKGVGMSDKEVVAFVDRYLPVYKLYYHKLIQEGSLERGHNLKIEIDHTRTVQSTTIL
ncbi:putative ATP-dependent kinase [Saccharomycopsis crataegensis]|uniref:ATP-dependent kinase n=1 Tax=Saccharomycopsis crataegensis TaxID=43959 RepID=A0AAV5QSG3_9ASCO|nr:putative ATP-dependent kinase [Saccharomycopsis crataegensis]